MKTRYALALAMLAGIGIGAAGVSALQAQGKAPLTYFVAEIDVTDHDGFLKDYVPRAEANVKAFGGRILAATSRVATIEGAPPRSRVVILSWEGIEKVQSWRSAPETMEIRALGHKYATFRSFIVEGVP
jgi:uncharacterized protein (DUF1330 family)